MFRAETARTPTPALREGRTTKPACYHCGGPFLANLPSIHPSPPIRLLFRFPCPGHHPVPCRASCYVRDAGRYRRERGVRIETDGGISSPKWRALVTLAHHRHSINPRGCWCTLHHPKLLNHRDTDQFPTASPPPPH